MKREQPEGEPCDSDCHAAAGMCCCKSPRERSNSESGDGFSDILIEIEEERIGIVIEVKYPDDQDLEAGCKKALDQIEKVGYQTRLCQDGMETVYKYGIACWKKRCMVRLGESQNVLWSDQS